MGIPYIYAEIWAFGISVVSLQLILDIKYTASLYNFGCIGGNYLVFWVLSSGTVHWYTTNPPGRP